MTLSNQQMDGHTIGRNWSERPPFDIKFVDAEMCRRGKTAPGNEILGKAVKRQRAHDQQQPLRIWKIFLPGIGKVRKHIKLQVRQQRLE